MRRRRPTVAVIGLGLVGGSVARALTAAGFRVLGVDRPSILGRARGARAIARGHARLDGAVAGADVVVLAAPPRTNLALLRRLARMGSRAVITDVSSVKGPICEEAKRLRLLRFVGGHPMAGGEGRGFAASSRSLFRGRPWILTPASSRAAARTVREMVAATGATSVRMDAAAHDRAVAFLSHAPQIVAWALRSAAREDPTARRHLRVAGPGYRDMTRLARSPRRLWRDILRQNEREVVRAVDALQRALARTLAGVAEIRPRPLRSLLSSSSRRVSP